MTIPAYDAWALRRLLCVEAVNGELQAVSEAFRPMAERLAAVLVDEILTGQARREALAAARFPVWEIMLAARDDVDAIVMALAATDPEGPAPERDDAPEAWLPLRFGGLPPAEPFPVEVLPEAAARLVIDGATAIGCPRDFLAVPVLAVAGGVIGRSVALRLKPGYFAGSTLYAGCIGPPSDGKTPALKAAAAAVRSIDKALQAEHEQALERWEESARPGPDGKKPKPPPRPKPRRIDVDDITMEVIPIILADNPRGIIRINDELTSMILGMNQFKAGKGNDRPNALKIWSGDSIKKDRVAHEDHVPIRCDHPCLTIVGGLTPDMLGSLTDPRGRADGFIDRFLLTYPDPLPVAEWSGGGLPEDTAETWRALVARLWIREMNPKDDRLVPHVARFTPEAADAWVERYNEHVAEMNAPGFNPALRGPWGKLREYAGRLALILACLHHAADPLADPSDVPEVGPLTVAHAWRLVAYFKSHARRVHATIALGPGIGGGPVVAAVVAWIRKGGCTSFSERDVKQARRWIDSEELTAALSYLASRNAIRAQTVSNPGPQGGRPPTPVYDVNPRLLVTQNSRNPQNPGPRGEDAPGFECFESFEYEQGGN